MNKSIVYISLLILIFVFLLLDKQIVLNGDIANWLVAIGTLALAFATVFQDKFRDWIKRPIIKLKFVLSNPDCNKLPVYDTENHRDYGNWYYFRIMVLNCGNTPANNVEVIAKSLINIDTGNNEPLFIPMNLSWSHFGNPVFPSINNGIFKHVDLGHIMNPRFRVIYYSRYPEQKEGYEKSTDTLFNIATFVQPNSKGNIIPKGNYLLELVVAGSNFKPSTYKVKISLFGKWEEDEAKMYKEGINIELIDS